MFKNKKLIYVILIIVFSIILFLEKKQFASNIVSLESDNKTSSLQNPKSTEAKEAADKTETGATSSSSSDPLKTDAPEALKRFEAWVRTEAAALEQSTDQKAKEAELRKVASALTAGEIDLLKQKSVSTTATANERIFSTYLLTLGSENTTTKTLLEVAQKGLSLPSPQPTHSLGEAKLMQEKALRTMAIDELFSRASKNPNLRNDFLQMATHIQDPALRTYALRRYNEFKED